jgi:hypothetical protein
MALYHPHNQRKKTDLSKTRATGVFCLTTAFRTPSILTNTSDFQSSHLNLIFSQCIQSYLIFPMVDALSLFSINLLTTSFSQRALSPTKNNDRFGEFSVFISS